MGNTISNARLAGLISWEAIVDRTRNVRANQHFKDVGDILEAAAGSYRLDLWGGQEQAVEVWIEKEALIGVIEPVCVELDLPYFACRGYVSQSEQWRAGQRAMTRWNHDGQKTVILHLGDHDPSGIDMTRDNLDRLAHVMGGDVELKRIALNMDQVEQYSPPPNPAKVTDSRWQDYMAEFGPSSWELDALEPSVINELIETEVAKLRDDDLFNERLAQQDDDRDEEQRQQDPEDPDPAHRPGKSGLRLAKNAAVPSRMSSPAKQRPKRLASRTCASF